MEDALALLDRDPRALVRHAHAQLLRVGARDHANDPARGRVRDRVGHHVAQRDLHQFAVDLQRQALRDLHRQLHPRRRRRARAAPDHRVDQRLDRDLLAARRRAGARQLQQRLHQARHVLHLRQRAVGHLLPGLARARPSARDLQRARQHRERRAQLVRRVGRELALQGDALLEPREQPVEGDGQRVELIAGGRHGQALAQVLRGHAGRGGDHRVDATDRAAGEPARRGDGEEEAEGSRDQHRRPDLREGLVERRHLRRAGGLFLLLLLLGDLQDQRRRRGEHREAQRRRGADPAPERGAERAAAPGPRHRPSTFARIPALRIVSSVTGVPASLRRRCVRWTSIALVPGSPT